MTYQKVNEGTKNAMRLQSIGLVLGTPAGELKEGDTLMWNFGETSTVSKITKQTDKTIWIEELYETGDKEALYSRRLKKTRLVCILKPKN